MIHLFKWLFLLGIVCPFQVNAQNKETASVTVVVNGIESKEGSIQIAFFSTKASFPDEKPYKANKLSLNESGEVTLIFKDIPFGEYALAVYQDKNDNDKLDTNLVGIPKEPYGFSNNHNPKFSRPNYDEAKVEIRQASQTLNVKIE
ncbi:DUF2141 domain-containing protein [Catalinimonas niigatensis]|uniref:DUF2141 domain-containing protein n=1 Tax=Catalinimonas niigatensis TaxID=1397264 RepID=UPI0026660490|nr:DUF2141 domain-containing protein [Catalinimonas niigatensis]WPP50857.1 DUF2141 domain-containing protein [Catalinimonas niigatensis]